MKKIISILFVLASMMSVAQVPVDFEVKVGDSVYIEHHELKLPTDTIPVIIIACDTSFNLVKYSDCSDHDQFFIAHTVITFDGYRCDNPYETYFLDSNKIRLSNKFNILLWQAKK